MYVREDKKPSYIIQRKAQLLTWGSSVEMGRQGEQGHPPAQAAAKVMCAHVMSVRGKGSQFYSTSYMRGSKAIMGHE